MPNENDNTRIMVAINDLGTKVEANCKTTDDIHARLFGNGSPGMIVTLDRHDRWIKFYSRIHWIFIVSAAGVVTPAAIGAAIWLIRNIGSTH